MSRKLAVKRIFYKRLSVLLKLPPMCIQILFSNSGNKNYERGVHTARERFGKKDTQAIFRTVFLILLGVN